MDSRYLILTARLYSIHKGLKMKRAFLGLVFTLMCGQAMSAQLTAGKFVVAASGTTIQDSVMSQAGTLVTVAGAMTLTGATTTSTLNATTVNQGGVKVVSTATAPLYITSGNLTLDTSSITGTTDHAALSNLTYATAGHTGFVPDTRTINSKPLSGNIVLGQNDIDLSLYAKLASPIFTGTVNLASLTASGLTQSSSLTVTGATTLGTTTASSLTGGTLVNNTSATFNGVADFNGLVTGESMTFAGQGTFSQVNAALNGNASTATLAAGSTTTQSDNSWTYHNNFPSACSAGQYVSAIGDTLTCATPAGGASMPLSYLTVSGQSTLSGDVTIGSASTTYFSAQADLGVKGALEVDGGIYAMSTLSALGTGNVGIGTTNPVSKFQIGSATKNWVSGTNDMLVAGGLEIDGNMYTDGSIRASGSGNFGIGTTSPATTLDIGGGTIYATLGANSAHIAGSLEVDTSLYVYGQKAVSGSVTVCIDTLGKIVKSATACSGS
jgi:hypothetical protein